MSGTITVLGATGYAGGLARRTGVVDPIAAFGLDTLRDAAAEMGLAEV